MGKENQQAALEEIQKSIKEVKEPIPEAVLRFNSLSWKKCESAEHFFKGVCQHCLKAKLAKSDINIDPNDYLNMAWANLPTESAKFFHDMAEADKTRFEKERSGER